MKSSTKIAVLHQRHLLTVAYSRTCKLPPFTSATMAVYHTALIKLHDTGCRRRHVLHCGSITPSLTEYIKEL
jgi:hypothetical protein